MSWHSILGVGSAFSLLIPIILVLALKLFHHRSFLALLMYYLISAVYNLIGQNVLYTSPEFARNLGITNNLTDAPLMLMFMVLFSTNPLMTKRIHIALFVFLAFELVVVSAYGFSVKTVKIILGPGIGLILTLSFIFFLRNVRLAITNYKSLGKAIMISSVLLAYSIFSLIYIYYYVLEILKNDTRLVYYIVSLLSALLMAVGIWIENKRIKKLAELKHTRKELATIYGQTKTAAMR